MISLATFCKRKASRCTLPGTLEIRILYNNENEKNGKEQKKKRVEKNVNTLNICRSQKKIFISFFF